ncbi:hypothetical protein FALBO_15525 [Fusarium albosuccineum]|uniref:ABM domain-containing protein n=1 Tax=Fusarium albosuccineum TaxID=1237068 RepID=A0A8H4KTK0_9HYPO|nr:hypothetical protein FALBO_15525 [Fusarium albosuccineum]
MAVTEFVFPHLNPDPVLLQSLKEILPAAAKATFSDVTGLLGYHRGRIVQARNVTENTTIDHSGMVIVLEWDDISSFDSFWASDKFAAFRETIKPYLLRPVAPDLFTSDEQSQSGGTTESKFTQYVKIEGAGDAVQDMQSDWYKLVSALGGQEKASFNAWGSRDKTMFAGMIGWDSVEDFEAATKAPSYSASLENKWRPIAKSIINQFF